MFVLSSWQTKQKYQLPVILKEQRASFPDESLNIYVTCDTPTIKLSPGRWDCTLVGITPQSSVAAGSDQLATLLGVPSGTVYVAD